jgi:mannose-6-phosphate isomerase
VLCAAQPLSIQVHPNKQASEIGFAKENAAGIPLDAAERNYKDPNHKPELVLR